MAAENDELREAEKRIRLLELRTRSFGGQLRTSRRPTCREGDVPARPRASR